MSETNISIAQKACVLASLKPITGFDDDTTEAEVLNLLYEPMVAAELSGRTYRFATKYDELNRLIDAPLAYWSAAYEIPSWCLCVRAVLVEGVPIEFDEIDGEIHCDASEDDTVILKGTFRAVEENWRPDFQMAIIYKMASALAAAVPRHAELAVSLDEVGEKRLMRARPRDSQAGKNKRLPTNRFMRPQRGR